MLTALVTIMGALSGAIPSVIQYFQKKQDNAFELEKIKINATIQKDIADSNALSDEGKSLYIHDSSLDGGKFWNAFRASVRPTLTYAFFFLFVFVKVCAIIVMMRAGLNLIDTLPIIWDENTQAIFGAIMGFWFGSRGLSKLGYNNTIVKKG